MQLAAGKGRCGAIEREVTQADFLQETQPLRDLVNKDCTYPLQALAVEPADAFKKEQCVRDREGRDLMQPSSRESHRAGGAVEPGPAALRAGDKAEQRRQRRAQIVLILLLSLIPQAPQRRQQALVTLEQGSYRLCGQGFKGRLALGPVGEGGGDFSKCLFGKKFPEAFQNLCQRQAALGNDARRIELPNLAIAGAARAGAVGVVEAESPRLGLRDLDEAAWTLEDRAVSLVVPVAVVDVGDDDPAAALLQRRVQRFRQPFGEAGTHHQSVDDHLDGVLLPGIEPHGVANFVKHAVHPGPQEAPLPDPGKNLFVVAGGFARERRQQINFASLGESKVRRTISATECLITGVPH